MNEKYGTIDPVDLAISLVRIPSYEKEKPIAEFIKSLLEELGFNVRLDEVQADRPNVTAVLESGTAGPTLMYCGHLDTVPPASFSQLKPEVRNGKLVGRGSADMKSGVSAMLSTLNYFAANKDEWSGKIIFLGTMGEEIGLLGMNHFVKNNLYGNKIDACIIGEPTSLDIGIAHKGMAWLQLNTMGKEAHSSKPYQGVNAIYHMALIVKALEENLKFLLEKHTHPLLGTPTVNVSIIHGGKRANMVPHECVIEIDRRVLPGEILEAVLEEIKATIDPLKNEYPQLSYELSVKKYNGPFEIKSDEKFIETVADAVSFCLARRPEIKGLSFGTDASELSVMNIPTVVIGPGSPNQAHKEEEWIDIEEIRSAFEIYKQIGLSYLSK